MWAIAADCCSRRLSVYLSVCLSLCRSLTTVNPANTAEAIDMPFVGQRLSDDGGYVSYAESIA